MIFGATQVDIYPPYAYPSAERQNLIIRLPVGIATKPVVTTHLLAHSVIDILIPVTTGVILGTELYVSPFNLVPGIDYL